MSIFTCYSGFIKFFYRNVVQCDEVGKNDSVKRLGKKKKKKKTCTGNKH